MTKYDIIDRLFEQGHVTTGEADILRGGFKTAYEVKWAMLSDPDGWPIPGSLFRTREAAELSAAKDYPFHEAWVEETWVCPEIYAVLK